MNDRLHSPLVDTNWLAKRLHSPKLRIMDCSVGMRVADDGSYEMVADQSSWEESHIPGSIFVDVINQLSDPDHDIAVMMPAAEKFIDILKSLGVGDNTQVVLYDRGSHVWAARVWWMLRVCGFDNAAVLNGGWQKWSEEGHEVSQEKTTYPSAKQLTLNYRPELIATKAEVLKALSINETTLMHCMPIETFTGEVSPYSRAGRIPGSENLCCETLVDQASKCYLDTASLRKQMATTSALEASRVITYCGGGVAASSNALALTLLGVSNVAVYDGSLSEWTADPNMPMETG